MFRFGYDFYDDNLCKILKPNGTLDYDDATGKVFQLFLPPWWGELLNKNNFKWGTYKVSSIVKEELDSKWIYMIEPLGDSRGWLGQYRDENPNVIKSLTAGMSKESLSSVRDNKAIICLYQAGEAAPVNHVDINLFEEFYKELLKHKIDPSNFVFITGNMIAKEQFSKWKPNSEYKNEKDFRIIEFSGYRHIDYKQKWTLAKKDLNKNIEKHFLCYNGNLLHPHRLFLLALLQEKKILSNGLISFDKIEKYHSKVFHNNLRDWFGLGKKLISKTVKYLKEIKSLSPSIIDVDEWKTNHFDTSPPWPYEKTFFSLVSESQVVEDTLFLSEKIWKAIANRHPFVLVGSYKTLDYLHKEGFKTFHPFIDESYDKEKHPYKRIMKVIEEVKKLCSMNQLEINEFLSNIDDIIEYNYDKLINDHYHIDRTFKELEAITNA
jgi:hypothetical protein